MFDSLDGRVAHLAGPLREWAATDLAHHPDAALPDDVEALLRLRDMVDGELMRRLVVCDRSGAAAVRGGGSTIAWLRDAARMDHRHAWQLVRDARRLADALPATAQALAAGDLSAAHARVLARAVTPDRLDRAEQQYPGGMAAAERDLLDIAVLSCPTTLSRAVQRWAYGLDPQPLARNQESRYLARELYLSTTFEGMLDVRGSGDADGGEVVLTAVQAASAPTGPDDLRSAAQRRWDALVDICAHSLTTGATRAGPLPDVAGERPQVLVTVSLETLQNLAGAPAAELGHLGPVHGETARRYACDAGVSRVLTDGASETLDVGRRTRTISPALRRALVARDGGCVNRGCDRPPSWCQAHHRTHWADGGTTDLDNLVLVCRRHHRLLHEGQLGLDPAGRRRWTVVPYRRPRRHRETSVGAWPDPSAASAPSDDDAREREPVF